MRSSLRTLSLGLLALCGSVAMAQNLITVMGTVAPCNGTPYPVRIYGDPGTLPLVDTTIYTTANCSFSYAFSPTSNSGGIVALTSCDGGLTWGAADSALYSAPVDTLVVHLNCGGGPANCQAAFSMQQAVTSDSTLIPWQMTTTNLSVGPSPIIFDWFLPDGSTSTAGEPTFTFTQPGTYGICLTISAGTCSSVVCDTVVVDSMGFISTQPVWYDCLGTMWGPNMPGTSCDDGNPMTTGDTWQSNCTCVGNICEAPVVTAPSGALAICSSDSLVLQAIATGTGQMTYSWTGPGTFLPNNTSQTVYLHDAASGIYLVTVTNACGTAGSEVYVNVTPAPNAGTNTNSSICDITLLTDMIILLEGNPQTGGTWTYGGQPHSGVFNPGIDSLGTYTYTVIGTAPCSSSTAYLNILPTPTWYGDADGDGLGDPNITLQTCTPPTGYVNNAADFCPFIFGTVGSACDDGNPSTSYDQINANCECVGTDSTYFDCQGIPGGNNLPGTACTDSTGGLFFTGTWDANCTCQPSVFFDCLGIAGGSNLPGTACTQSSGVTGTWDANCYCIPDSSTTTCNASFWVIQAYDSTSTGVEPIPNEVWVWNLSSGGNGNYQFLWNFGDGSSSTEAYPTHVYTSDGPWTLCLTMSSDNCTDSYCDSVSVGANGILNQFVIDGGHGTVGHSSGSGARSEGFTLNVIQQIPTSITEIPAFAELKAWPNPVMNELNLTLHSRETGAVPVTVIDPSGRTVVSENHRLSAGSNIFMIPTSTLEPGLYMVRIGNDANSITQRFIKVR